MAGNDTEVRSLSHLLHPITLQNTVREWLKEDMPCFDYGGFVVGEKMESALLLCKSTGILAGSPFFDALFKELDCKVEWIVNEGCFIEAGVVVAKITGKVRHLLIGERVALNCISRSSGIATFAKSLSLLGTKHGWKGEIAGTRKTTPGFRLVEKYSLLVGTISTHRYDLSSMIMLKDNHIWSAGSITQAVQDAKQVGGFCLKIEVECRSLDEAIEAATAGCDVVMLDNFDPETLHRAAHDFKGQFPHVLVEASGGISEENITQYFGPHVDVISLSKTTQGYQTLDFSFKIVKEGHDPMNPTVRHYNVIE